MATINNILIPTDFSETATLAKAHGAKMAQLFNAKIFLLHSVETTLYTAGVGEPVMMPDIQDIYKEATEQLNKAAEALKTEYAVAISPIIANGRPAAAIASSLPNTRSPSLRALAPRTRSMPKRSSAAGGVSATGPWSPC